MTDLLTRIADYLFYSIYIVDGNGKTLFVNKAFEEQAGVPRALVLGRNVSELEEDGIFSPSAANIVLKEKREVTILQRLINNTECIVTAVPVFDKHNNVEYVVSNTRKINDITNEKIRSYIKRNQEIPLQGGIVHGSRTTENLLSLLGKIAHVDSTVMLLGESGVGKSMYAKYIHDNSSRKDKRMVEINCGAIPDSLLESELFGYEPGAFTGAQKCPKKGLIEIADQGTLFLDEIGDMPLFLQVKLLHVIQERNLTRIGGAEPIDVNIRIIVATNKNLQELISRGEFREDLYYRLNVIPISIEPLRNRIDDIEPLVQFFLNKYNEKYDRQITLEKGVVNALKRYQWPGNVRELENCIERLVVTSSFDTITMPQLPDYIIYTIDARLNPMSNNVVNTPAVASSEKRLPEKLDYSVVEDAEKQLIIEAYKKYPSSYKLAAALGISQSSAYKKIKKYIKTMDSGETGDS